MRIRGGYREEEMSRRSERRRRRDSRNEEEEEEEEMETTEGPKKVLRSAQTRVGSRERENEKTTGVLLKKEIASALSLCSTALEQFSLCIILQ